MIDRFPSSQKFKKNHAKAVDVTLLCQLASHSISVTNMSIKVERKCMKSRATNISATHAKNKSMPFVTNVNLTR